MESIGCSQSPKSFKVGDILYYERYKINEYPPKYFKCISVDEPWGVVGYEMFGIDDTIGFAYVTKANFFQKIIYYIFY